VKRDEMITELLAARARFDEVIAALRAEVDVPTKPVPTFMKLGEFCERWGISRSTLHTRIGEGLPVLGDAHNRRIKTVDGDEWMAKRVRVPSEKAAA
jgi:hypothetical protein